MSIFFNPLDTPLPVEFFEKKYGLSRTTIWRYRKAGLVAFRVGAKCFIRESDFAAFLEKMNCPQGGAAAPKSGKEAH